MTEIHIHCRGDGGWAGWEVTRPFVFVNKMDLAPDTNMLTNVLDGELRLCYFSAS